MLGTFLPLPTASTSSFPTEQRSVHLPMRAEPCCFHRGLGFEYHSKTCSFSTTSVFSDRISRCSSHNGCDFSKESRRILQVLQCPPSAMAGRRMHATAIGLVMLLVFSTWLGAMTSSDVNRSQLGVEIGPQWVGAGDEMTSPLPQHQTPISSSTCPAMSRWSVLSSSLHRRCCQHSRVLFGRMALIGTTQIPSPTVPPCPTVR